MVKEIRFCKPEGEYWFLSPLAAFPIKMSVDGKAFTFPTVEQLLPGNEILCAGSTFSYYFESR